MDYSLLIGVVRRNFEVLNDFPGEIPPAELGNANEENRRMLENNDIEQGGLSSSAGKAADATATAAPTSSPSYAGKRSISVQSNRSQFSCYSLGTASDRNGTEVSGTGISLETYLRDGMNVEVVEAPGTYYIGLIDMLQEWNFNKKIER
jgi:hypothetical protein